MPRLRSMFSMVTVRRRQHADGERQTAKAHRVDRLPAGGQQAIEQKMRAEWR